MQGNEIDRNEITMKEELRSLMQPEIVLLLHGSSSKLSKDECVMSL